MQGAAYSHCNTCLVTSLLTLAFLPEDSVSLSTSDPYLSDSGMPTLVCTGEATVAVVVDEHE